MYKHEIVAGEVCGICVHYYQHYIFRHGKYSAITNLLLLGAGKKFRDESAPQRLTAAGRRI